MTDEGRRQDKGPNIIPPEYATRSVDLLDIVGFTLKYHGGLRLGYQWCRTHAVTRRVRARPQPTFRK